MNKGYIPVYSEPVAAPRSSWLRKFSQFSVVVGCLVLLYLNGSAERLWNSTGSFFSFPAPTPAPLKIADYLLDDVAINFTPAADVSTIQEVIEVSAPLPTYLTAAFPVYQNEIITNYSFGNSWGEPAIAEYTPPSVEFNKVVVNITTNSTGVQYDRLSHLFLNDVSILRSSTAEPGNRNITFTVSKDLSDYLSLFKTAGSLVYQLDNIVDEKLTGAFNVSITISYYNIIATAEEESSSILLSSIDETSVNTTAIAALFSVLNSPATLITPLTTGAKTPLVYLPSDSLDVELPILDATTVVAIFRLFISGNADEEFWYSNVIDANKDKLGSKIGKGPVRVVKVYINDQLVSVQSPRPVIYTGGISPTLWSAVVGTGAFDVGHIDVDLTAFLPLLWTSAASIKVVVETGSQYPSFPIYPPHPPSDTTAGENWIASASLLSWSNENVTFSSGAALPPSPAAPPKDIVISPPSSPMKITQIVSHSESASNGASFRYTIDGTNVTFCYTSENSVKFSNVQNYKKFGASSSLVSNIKNSKKVSLSTLLTETAICSYEISSKYSTIINLNIDDTPVTETIVNVTLVQASSFSKSSSASKKALEFNRYGQNGTAQLHLSETGNFGTGSLRTKIAVSGKPGYKRTVDSENGTIIKDSLAPSTANEDSEDGFFTEIFASMFPQEDLKHCEDLLLE